eukprot:TRINITY_DN112_c0_g1_i1.p2 TRINITY_DN112_c0_g1~~TRINITY_DN112_c0_g1_i1.p2  ORF type:complete len:112 (-),score=30.94 TRINITY_DN112_c0_g1_i1:45-380(-)
MQSVTVLLLALIAIAFVDAKKHKKAKEYKFEDNDFDSINDADEGYVDTYEKHYFFKYYGQEAPSQWQLTDDEEDLEFSDYYDDDSEDDRWVDYEEEEGYHHKKKHHKNKHH